jgi:hypothetical protein
LAKDGLIEIIDDHGFVGIQCLTAKGELILKKAPDLEKSPAFYGHDISQLC